MTKKLLFTLLACSIFSVNAQEVISEPAPLRLRVSGNIGLGIEDYTWTNPMNIDASVIAFEGPSYRWGYGIEGSHMSSGSHTSMINNDYYYITTIQGHHLGVVGALSMFPRNRVFNMVWTMGLGGCMVDYIHQGTQNSYSTPNNAPIRREFHGLGVLLRSNLEFDFSFNEDWGMGFGVNMAVPYFIQTRMISNQQFSYPIHDFHNFDIHNLGISVGVRRYL